MNRRCFVIFWLIDVCISLMWRISMWFLHILTGFHPSSPPRIIQLIKPLLIMEHFSISTGELCGFLSIKHLTHESPSGATQPEGGIQLEYSCYNRSLDVGHCVGNRTLVKTPKIQDERIFATAGLRKGGGGAMSWTKSLGYTISNIL